MKHHPNLINNLNKGFISVYDNNAKNPTLNGIGGILGVAGDHNATISNNFNSGVVQSNLQNVGCIIGRVGTNTILINNHYDKQMCGEED